MILTVLVNAHREGRYLTAAIRSVHEALVVAELEPPKDAEILLVMDRPDDITVDVANLLDVPGLRRIVVDHGDLGSSRNAGIVEARGQYLALLDADDVWGSHWIRRGLADPRIDDTAIMHPQMAVTFPDRINCWQSPDMADPAFHVTRLLIENCWTSLALARTEVFRAFPYRTTHDHRQYGYEDWAWNGDTIAAGFSHHIVPETVHFIRKRNSSLSASSSTAGALPIPHALTAAKARAIMQEQGLLAKREASCAHARKEDVHRASRGDQTIRNALRSAPELFDAQWYTSQLAERIPTDVAALDHFLDVGRSANLSPGPWLDPQWYWKTYEDVAKAGQCAFDHYALHGEREGRAPHPTFVPRLDLLTQSYSPGVLELTANSWARRASQGDTLDPKWLFHEKSHAALCEPQLSRISDDHLVRAIPGVHWNHLEPLVDQVIDVLQGIELLILVPHFKLGGADRVAANIAKVAADLLGPERVVVISTDAMDTDSMRWFPPQVRVRRMQRSPQPDLTLDEAGAMLANLLLTIRPRTVLNINSLAGWRAFRDFGRTLSAEMSLLVTQFCRDQFPHGGMGGYGDDYLRDTIDYLDMIILDNAAFKTTLINDLGLTTDDTNKMHVLYQPCDLQSDPGRSHRSRGNQILWLGRIVDQKRPGLVSQIAEIAPDLEIHMYGGPSDAGTVSKYGLNRPNIRLHGPVASISEIPVSQYDAVLFTSAYEGLPNVPLELGCLGLPIVASAVGGLPELIDASTGWPMPDGSSAEAYADALREALEGSEGPVRAAALLERLRVRHSWPAFRSTFISLGLCRPDVPTAPSSAARDAFA